MRGLEEVIQLSLQHVPTQLRVVWSKNSRDLTTSLMKRYLNSKLTELHFSQSQRHFLRVYYTATILYSPGVMTLVRLPKGFTSGFSGVYEVEVERHTVLKSNLKPLK